MPLDDALLKDFITTFQGYGDYRAKYWLVGMEEGGGGSHDEVERRLRKWDLGGRPELLDLRAHHIGGDLSAFMSGTEKLQPTWSQLIRIVLGSEGRPSDNEAVRAYQQFRLGRPGGETCLLELMPLPSPNAVIWNYAQWSSIPDLKTRSRYTEQYRPSRIRTLWHKIREHRPPVVVFYSLTNLPQWKQAAGVNLVETSIEGVKSFSGHNEHTQFLVISQPAHRVKGKGNDYYIQVGREISGALSARG